MLKKQNLRKFSLEEIKSIELEMLCWFDDYCKKNNIKYFLFFGTLLGAIRHKGFIPWDDDIDIGMLREDYDKLIDIMKNQQDRYQFVCPENNRKYNYQFGKLIDTRSFVKEDGINCGIELGFWIDIFPFDNDVKDINKRMSLNNKLVFLNKLFDFIRNTTNHKSKGLKLLFAKILKFIFNFIGTRFIMKFYLYLVKKDNNLKTNYVSLKTVFYKPTRMFTKDMFYTIPWKFEGYQLPVPKDYDNILKSLYGNYMVPPPPEQQINHHKVIGFFNKY